MEREIPTFNLDAASAALAGERFIRAPSARSKFVANILMSPHFPRASSFVRACCVIAIFWLLDVFALVFRVPGSNWLEFVRFVEFLSESSCMFRLERGLFFVGYFCVFVTLGDSCHTSKGGQVVFDGHQRLSLITVRPLVQAMDIWAWKLID